MKGAEPGHDNFECNMIDQSNPLIIGSVPFLQLNKEYKKNLESLPAGRQGYA